jgi:hypothetical protein
MYTIEGDTARDSIPVTSFAAFCGSKDLRKRPMDDVMNSAVVYAPDYTRVVFHQAPILGLDQAKAEKIFARTKTVCLGRKQQVTFWRAHDACLSVTVNRDLTVSVNRGEPLAPTDPAAKYPAGTFNRRALEWLLSDDTGTSSRTIVAATTGLTIAFHKTGTPRDMGDFGRCVRMLDALPELRSKLYRVSERHPEWSPLIERWGELQALYRKAIELDDPNRVFRSTLAEVLEDVDRIESGHARRRPRVA